MYESVAETMREVIPPEKLAYVTFLHFGSDEWGEMEFLKSSDVKLLCSDSSSKLNVTGWDGVPIHHIAFRDNDVLRTGKRSLRFIMTQYVHHWDSLMIFEDTIKSLFPSDLFIQPGDNKPVTSDDLSEGMITLYRGTGIFAGEVPVRNTVKCLFKMEPRMTFPMHGSCIDRGLFTRYADALKQNEFVHSGMLLGEKLQVG